MARITIDVDLPPRWKSPVTSGIRTAMAWRCGGPCPHDAVVKNVATTTSPTSSSKESPRRSGTSTCGAALFLDLPSSLPSLWRCNYRQHIIPPFKRKDVSYTYRFQSLLRSLIGARRGGAAVGNPAETVDRIVENQLTEDRHIDPQRVITDIGLDELSLKKRHRLYVTLMTDLSDLTRPQILAVERGRDTTATLKCLDRLTQEQRQQALTHRVHMGRLIRRLAP